MTSILPSINKSNAEPVRRHLSAWTGLSLASILLLGGCASDGIDEAAMQASMVGTAYAQGRHGRDTVGLDAGSRVVEHFYYVAKYQASLEQRRQAEATARPLAARLVADARKSGHGSAPKYIAVRTRSDSRAKTRTSIVVWDTQSSEIVGNNVYDLNDTPPLGTVVKFETYSAQYVGTGDGGQG